MIVSYGIWASHEESDNDSEQNESEDSSQEKDQQDLKLAHVFFLFSISKKRSAWKKLLTEKFSSATSLSCLMG